MREHPRRKLALLIGGRACHTGLGHGDLTSAGPGCIEERHGSLKQGAERV